MFSHHSGHGGTVVQLLMSSGALQRVVITRRRRAAPLCPLLYSTVTRRRLVLTREALTRPTEPWPVGSLGVAEVPGVWKRLENVVARRLELSDDTAVSRVAGPRYWRSVQRRSVA